VSVSLPSGPCSYSPQKVSNPKLLRFISAVPEPADLAKRLMDSVDLQDPIRRKMAINPFFIEISQVYAIGR
jgi:hypothetical protein